MIVTIQPYLTMNGNGQEAVTFYEDALDAKVLAMHTFGEFHNNAETPMPDDVKNRVMNAQLAVGDTKLMISDTYPGPHEESYQLGNQVTIALMVSSVEKSQEVFNKLQDGGKVTMPLQETFWSPSYGQVTDKFGVMWQVSTEVSE
ncbi:VOC family protein [Pseudogracilibacillus auburnensis]|uniref:VOC family protein n=1 Tax=Pseudogracilibacillus auburnensis TaxID=1494959 RepID=UPI001A972164|nr:VOC family protein [Pseudogracilibacillus auburnensis]MBO1004364.1 VOC family protein [Pseudogracilibacillus auburnensis]